MKTLIPLILVSLAVLLTGCEPSDSEFAKKVHYLDREESFHDLRFVHQLPCDEEPLLYRIYLIDRDDGHYIIQRIQEEHAKEVLDRSTAVVPLKNPAINEDE